VGNKCTFTITVMTRNVIFVKFIPPVFITATRHSEQPSVNTVCGQLNYLNIRLLSGQLIKNYFK